MSDSDKIKEDTAKNKTLFKDSRKNKKQVKLSKALRDNLVRRKQAVPKDNSA
ncbi:MAG: hypothetical protein WCJ33_10025 [Pseudomonadota bacterium]